MADPPPLHQTLSYPSPIHLDPNLQVISPQVLNSTITTSPLQIVSPANWLQSPTGVIAGQPLQLAIIPPSMNSPSWPLSRSSSLTQVNQMNDSPSNTMNDPSKVQPNPDEPKKKKRKYTKRNTSDASKKKSTVATNSTDPKKNVSWKAELNSEGKSRIILIIEWLGTVTSTGTRYDWWKGEMDMDTRTIYSKKDLGEKVAQHLTDQGLPGQDGKGVETQIRNLEIGFTSANDFRNGTGQGILDDFNQQAQEEKIQNGYDSDSEEWKAIENSTKSKFDQLLFQKCAYYYDLHPFMSTRTNVIPQAVRESGDILDEDDILPSTKRKSNHSPISNASSMNDINDHERSRVETSFQDNLDDLELSQNFDLTEESYNHDLQTSIQQLRASPSPTQSSSIATARSTRGRRAKHPKSFNIDIKQSSRSTSTSASDVHNLLASQLPTREEKAERTQLEKDRWRFEEQYMQAEQDARQEELKTQAKLADAVSRHLSGGDDGLQDAERSERARLKMEQDRVQLELAKSHLARSREDLITARSDRKLAMLAKYKALGFSIEEAQKQVREDEEEMRKDLEDTSQGAN